MTSDPISILTDAIRKAIDSRLVDLHTALPGFVISYDDTTTTAQVQIAVRRVKSDGTELAIPPLSDVPVIFQRTLTAGVRLPVKKGDGCLVLFCERDIDGFRQTGGIESPVNGRMHDLSDPVCLVGFNKDSANVPLDAGDEDKLVIYTSGAKITLDETGNIKIGKAGSDQTEPLVLGNVLKSALTDAYAQIVAIIDAFVDNASFLGTGNAGGAVPINPAISGALNSAKATLESDKTKYVDTASSNIVSQKYFTERGN